MAQPKRGLNDNFLKDSRANLEANLGNEGGELGEFLNTMKLMGHHVHVFLSADSMFCDASFGDRLGSTSSEGWDLFINMNSAEKGKFDPVTGRRSKSETFFLA